MKIVVKLWPNRAIIMRFNDENSQIIGQKFTKFVDIVAELLLFNHLKADLRSANPLSKPKHRVKVVPGEHIPNLTGCYSNVPWVTAKRILG